MRRMGSGGESAVWPSSKVIPRAAVERGIERATAQTALSSSRDRTVRVWDLKTGPLAKAWWQVVSPPRVWH